MPASTIPISEASHRIIREIAEESGQSVSEVLDRAVDAYRRKVFLEAVNAGYAAMQAEPESWGEHESERKLWDATIGDGLEPGEQWTDDGRSLPSKQD